MASKNEKKSGNILTRAVDSIDSFQRRHHFISFPYAVVKKYGDDEAGHQAALVTYYGFLSLFPLLIIATSVTDLIAQNNSDLRDKLLANIDKYIPIVGDQLQQNVHGNNKTGLALTLGVIFALYGSRGIADAVRSTLDHAWAVPKAKRSGFPTNILRSMAILLGAGLGMVLTTALSSYATASLGHSIVFRLIPAIISVGLLYVIFIYVFTIGTSRRLPRKDLRLGAATAAIGLFVLQLVGVAIIKHALKNLSGLYGNFALVLALLSWVYLQAQVFIYAIEINVVHARKLWPRSLAGELTPADKKAYELYVTKEAMRPTPEEQINVTFHKKK